MLSLHRTIIIEILRQRTLALRSFRCDETAAALYVLCEGARRSSDQGMQCLRPWSSSRRGRSHVVSRQGGVERPLYDASRSELSSAWATARTDRVYREALPWRKVEQLPFESEIITRRCTTQDTCPRGANYLDTKVIEIESFIFVVVGLFSNARSHHPPYPKSGASVTIRCHVINPFPDSMAEACESKNKTRC